MVEEVKKELDILLHKYLHRDGIYTDEEFLEQICQLFDKRCKECKYDPQADKFQWAIDKGWLPKEEVEMLKAQEQQRVENFIENCELPCPHGVLLADTSKASKKDCDECWQVLKKEGI